VRSPVQIIPNQGRPGGRVYVAGVRCHHGAAGAIAVAWGLFHPTFAGGLVVALGVAAMIHDLPDFRRTFWLRDV
jgi:hypothetical protein